MNPVTYLSKEQLCQRLSYSSHKITHRGHIFFYVMHDVIWTTSSSAAHFKWCFTHLATLWLSFVSKRLNLALTHTHTHMASLSVFLCSEAQSRFHTLLNTNILSFTLRPYRSWAHTERMQVFFPLICVSKKKRIINSALIGADPGVTSVSEH